ncbi:hypothetical protein Pla52n_60640 [Stieleria varia]|uniref:Uncharacterized protein n=1 Tax=Stieleria varia TaxID=2528005 RepID=A0A5C5ZZH5_9BACT|nr:hypothetical protein Pla52n_60640 [Stieleria varia]
MQDGVTQRANNGGHSPVSQVNVVVGSVFTPKLLFASSNDISTIGSRRTKLVDRLLARANHLVTLEPMHLSTSLPAQKLA